MEREKRDCERERERRRFLFLYTEERETNRRQREREKIILCWHTWLNPNRLFYITFSDLNRHKATKVYGFFLIVELIGGDDNLLLTATFYIYFLSNK